MSNVVPELTPEMYKRQQDAIHHLEVIRSEGDTFFVRRDDAIRQARAANMSYRQIASYVGLSYQGVSDVLKRPVPVTDPNQEDELGDEDG